MVLDVKIRLQVLVLVVSYVAVVRCVKVVAGSIGIEVMSIISNKHDVGDVVIIVVVANVTSIGLIENVAVVIAIAIDVMVGMVDPLIALGGGTALFPGSVVEIKSRVTVRDVLIDIATI